MVSFYELYLKKLKSRPLLLFEKSGRKRAGKPGKMSLLTNIFLNYT